jgi:hypothetical protein
MGYDPKEFEIDLTIVEMPILTQSPSTELKYNLEGKGSSLRAVLSAEPNDEIFSGPVADFYGYDGACCCILDDTVDDDQEVDGEGEEEEEEEEEEERDDGGGGGRGEEGGAVGAEDHKAKGALCELL